MFLSVRHRILFVHVAKTGGTSIRSALGRLRWTDPYSIPLYIGNHIARATKYRTPCKLHRHARAATARDMLGAGFFGELFKFAFVRNPWDLQVSSWLHIGRMKHRPLGWGMTFEDFLHTRFDRNRPPSHSIDVINAPQTHYLSDFEGNLLVDFVGRFESLAADFGEVTKRAGLPSLRLGHRLKAPGRHDYRSYYTDELAEFVASWHQEDIDRFGYTFDGPAEVAEDRTHSQADSEPPPPSSDQSKAET